MNGDKEKKKQFQIKNKRIFAGTVSLVIAVVLTFIVIPLYNSRITEEASVVRVKTEIPEGKQITALDIETVSVGKYNLPSNIYMEESEVVGMYAASDLLPGDYIVKGKLLLEPDEANAYLLEIPEDQMAVSIGIDFAQGLSGKLEPGDIVSVVATVSDTDADTSGLSEENMESGQAKQSGDNTKTYIPKELQYVKVIAVTAENGNDTDAKKIADNDKLGDAASLPATVTLLVDQTQLTTLVAARNQNKVYLALVCRGEGAESYLELQKQYLTNLK